MVGVSEQRKAVMRSNYADRKLVYNMNKTIQRLEQNKQLFVTEEKIRRYPWSEEHLAIINRYNALYKEERTLDRPIIVKPPPAVWPPPRNVSEVEQYPDPERITDKTYTQSMAEAYLRSRKDKNGDPYDAKTTNSHIRRIPALLEQFKVKTSNLMDIYKAKSVQDITKTIL